MDRFLYKILFIASLAFCFDALAVDPLAGKTITLTNEGESLSKGKSLKVKFGNRLVTISRNESKVFNFNDMKNAKAYYEGSPLPAKSLNFDAIEKKWPPSSQKMRETKAPYSNVNVTLIPDMLWGAKIARYTFGMYPSDAKRAYSDVKLDPNLAPYYNM